MLSHGAIAANAIALTRCWQFTSDDVLLHCLPLFHAHGLTVSAHCALLTGSSMIWLARFERAQVLDWLPRATVFMGVPTLYTRLLAEDEFTAARCRNVRLFTCGSAPLSLDTFHQFELRIGQRIVERYGMTETGINASNPLVGDRKAGSVGLPLEGTEIRIVDQFKRRAPDGSDGEVQIRGRSLFSGYWRNPVATSLAIDSAGWFSTGDVGCFDADGYLSLVSRIKDVIITGGYNVYPSEVEAALERLPGVREATVIGLPHPEFGEGVVGLVVLESEARLDERVIIAALKSTLAGYKVPKRLIAVEGLPRNALGKVLKVELRERYSRLLL
jgi:malonyl-CoA/methylmalonyl-CoA synthetase